MKNGLFAPHFRSHCFAVHCLCVHTKITLTIGGSHSVIIHENKEWNFTVMYWGCELPKVYSHSNPSVTWYYMYRRRLGISQSSKEQAKFCHLFVKPVYGIALYQGLNSAYA